MSLNIKVVKGVFAKSVMGKTIVCDTDPFFTEGLKVGIAKVAEGMTLSVVCFEKGGEVIELLREYPEEEYIVFLSMDLPDCDSIILANQISNLQPAAQIIFVSANDSAYLDVYEAEHIYFLKKPLDEQYLRKAMRKAFFQLERQRKKEFVVKDKQSIHKIQMEQILYFEKEKRKVHVHTLDARYSFYGKLRDIEEKINERFRRCHNSYIVNLAQARHFENHKISFENGEVVPVSKSYYQDIKRILED